MLTITGRREGAPSRESAIGRSTSSRAHGEGLTTPSRDSRPRGPSSSLIRTEMCEAVFARTLPRRTRARRQRAPMQGQILNESSYALNLIPKGGRRGCRAPGRRGSGVTGNQRSVHEVCKCQKKLAYGVHEVCSKTGKVCSKGLG